MKHIKIFEEFGILDYFKNRNSRLSGSGPNYISKSNGEGLKGGPPPSPTPESIILMDAEPYGKSQFQQDKYGIYIKKGNKYYYIGDLRKFDSSNYINYLDIERYQEKSPSGETVVPDEEAMDIINKQLDMDFVSYNLKDDSETLREFLKNEGVL